MVRYFYFSTFDERFFSRGLSKVCSFLCSTFVEQDCSRGVMPALLSPEGQIETALRELDCSGRNFVEVCKELNVQVSHGKLSEALNGKSQFDEQTARRLLEVANEL